MNPKFSSLHRKYGLNTEWFNLYDVIEYHIPEKVLRSKNKTRSWKYGYNEEYDVIIISKDGTLGEIYLIEGLLIGLPLYVGEAEKAANKWVPHTMDPELRKIRSNDEFMSMSQSFQQKHIPYINREWDRREHGMWFINGGVPTYITGKHYMYLQHSKIDVGKPDFRESNRVFWIHWEACVADERSFGQDYIKNRRSGFSYMASSETVDTGTSSPESNLGILSKSGPDAKKMFTGKVVPIANNYPFFFKPIQSGMNKPKTEIEYAIPASRITKKNMHVTDPSNDQEGLNTVISWRNTDDNSYDGEKLLRLVHDESGKWLKPNSITANWSVTKTCLRVGDVIVGKCMMGSTVNSAEKGGKGFKQIFDDSDPTDRNDNGETRSGLYRLFIPMEWNFEGYIDEYGWPVFMTPTSPVIGINGRKITKGVIEYWKNEEKSKKSNPDALNEFYRQYPRTISHAFRDESKESIFDLTKLYDQLDYNDSLGRDLSVVRGNFHWRDGRRDTEVIWEPDHRGRFYVSWLPPKDLQNRVLVENDKRKPLNAHLGGGGCDPYDISGVVDGSGSKGAFHLVTTSNIDDRVPSNKFIVEYAERPPTAEIFFDDVIKALHFYGMPALVENNKPRLLYEMKNRGYRLFSLDRPDKAKNMLSKTERELGGIPNNSEDVKQLHASCIESYIMQYVGYDHTGVYRDSDIPGDMPFKRTLQDWIGFKITDRTKFDLSISSGLALMGIRKDVLQPVRERNEIKCTFARYDNSGNISKMI